MATRTSKLIALVVTAAVAIATVTVGPLRSSAASAPARPTPRLAVPEQVCTDHDVARTLGGGRSVGCHAYLDACLGELSAHERAQWRRSVDACLSSDGSFYRCYAQVPWC